jgi:membrane dipeptidase
MTTRARVIAATALTMFAACTSEEELARQAAPIHEAALTVDTHIDWPSRQLRNPAFAPGERHEPGKRESGQWDLIRMKEGGLDAVFMSIFTAQGPRNEEGHLKAKEHALKLIEITKKMASDNPELAEMAYAAADAERIAQSGKRAIFMGMENGYPIGLDSGNVKVFYDLGVRYITITHSRNNELGDSSTDELQEWNGLSPLGESVVREMNRLGVMVDISHVHDETFWDVMAMTKAPVMASHSSSWAVNEHKRNMKDDMLLAVKKNNGVVQVCLLGDFIKKMPQSAEREAALAEWRKKQEAWRRGEMSPEQEEELFKERREINEKFPAKRPSLHDAMAHLDHMVKLLGVNHVGLGSDFDGGGGLLDIDDVSEMPNITKELVRRGYSEEDIRKIWGGNLFRVMREVEEVAQRLQKGAVIFE